MYESLAIGALGTLKLFAISYFPGLLLGFIVASASLEKDWGRVLSKASSIYIVTPMLAALFLFHYPFQQLLGVVWSGFISSAVTIGLYVFLSSYAIFYEGLKTSLNDYIEVSIVLGIDRKQAMYKILWPISIYKGMPRVLNLAIITLHSTMFASLLGVNELFRMAQKVNALYLKPVEIFTLMAVFYLVLSLPIFLLERQVVQRMRRMYGFS